MFEHVPAFAGDPILGLLDSFLADPRPDKVSLSIGIYFDDTGELPLMEAVRQAETVLLQDVGPRTYLPLEGLAAYRQAVQHLVFGEHHPAVQAGRIATMQSVGGSGGLKVGADFLHRFLPDAGIWVSDPTWDNHLSLFATAGLAVHTYPYYDPATGGLRFDAMLESIRSLPPRSIVLLHASCHNPTGVDLSRDQWLTLAPVIAERDLVAFVDMAYQGFGDGVEDDAFGVRALAGAGAQVFCANSLSKNFSLYGERCGGLSAVCRDADEAERMLGQFKFAVRTNYSSPPTHGARIAATVLTQPDLRALWLQELATMRARMKRVRQQLHEALVQALPGRDFDYLLRQRGMFSYTGLSPEQIDRLRAEHGVYLVRSGRMCIAGLNTRNIQHVARGMAQVLGH